MRRLLSQLGVDVERVTFTWCSASEGKKFADLINEVTEKIRKLGPYSDYRKLDLEVR